MFRSLWHKSPVPNRSPESLPRPPTVRPQVEALENRLVPASFSFNDVSGLATLSLQGDESVVVKHDGHGFISIVKDGVVIAEADDVETFNINGSSGNNVVRYLLTDTVAVDMDINVFLNNGNDRFTGTLNHDIFGSLDIKVFGGAGKDLITLYGTATVPNRADDNLTDGNPLNEGGLRIGSQGELFVALHGSAGNDRIFFDYNGDLDGSLVSTLTGGEQNDNVSAGLILRVGSTGDVGTIDTAARVEGNTGNDDLIFKIVNSSGGQAGVRAQVDGGEDSFLPFLDQFDRDRATRTANVVNFGGVEVDVIV